MIPTTDPCCTDLEEGKVKAVAASAQQNGNIAGPTQTIPNLSNFTQTPVFETGTNDKGTWSRSKAGELSCRPSKSRLKHCKQKMLRSLCDFRCDMNDFEHQYEGIVKGSSSPCSDSCASRASRIDLLQFWLHLKALKEKIWQAVLILERKCHRDTEILRIDGLTAYSSHSRSNIEVIHYATEKSNCSKPFCALPLEWTQRGPFFRWVWCLIQG